MTKTENIPAYLREHGVFCLWKYEEVNGRTTKVPYNPNSPQDRAQSNNRSTFAPLDTAAARANGFDGLGIGIFDSIAAIDIDHCMKGGKLSDMAADIVDTMDAYTEISPSGEGLRILFLAPGFRYDTEKYYINNQKSGLEIYLPGMTRKYVTVTGNTQRSRDILDRADRLQTILDKYMKRPQQTTQTAAPMPGTPADISDRDLLDKAMNARNGDTFKSLWDGSIMNYPSQSEADQALCNLLAFWTGKDAARMEALFRQSGLNREGGGRRSIPFKGGTFWHGVSPEREVGGMMEHKKKIKCELYNDSMQNWKSRPIQKAQLIIADVPYNIGTNFYGSNPVWYNGGDNRNGESKMAGKAAFASDFNFNLYEYFHFCSQLMKKEPKKGGERGRSSDAPCMIVFCSFQQIPTLIEAAKKHGFVHYIPLTFIKKSSPQALKANMRIVGATERALLFYRSYLPKFRNGAVYDDAGKPIRGTGHMVLDWMEWERDSKDIPKIHPTQKPVKLLKRLIEICTDPGDVVIDPCFGSGSTGRACIETGRSFYGFEINKEFYRRAKEEMCVVNDRQMDISDWLTERKYG